MIRRCKREEQNGEQEEKRRRDGHGKRQKGKLERILFHIFYLCFIILSVRRALEMTPYARLKDTGQSHSGLLDVGG